jgi:hypothetical protein
MILSHGERPSLQPIVMAGASHHDWSRGSTTPENLICYMKKMLEAHFFHITN